MIDVPAGGASHLFVYGTLRNATRMAEVLGDDRGGRYLGPAVVTGDLYDVGEYPALVLRDGDGLLVEGLLVELVNPAEAFRLLDAYEGVEEGLYVRRQCHARLADGTDAVVWVYEYDRPVRGLRRLDGQSDPDSSWRDRSTQPLERRR